MPRRSLVTSIALQLSTLNISAGCFRLCLRMTGDHAQAEDFTQEAFLQLFRKIGSFRGESAFSTWLHRLSVNIVLMQFRKKVLAEISLDETLDTQQEDKPRREIATRDNVAARLD